jgi:hypothetical protein
VYFGRQRAYTESNLNREEWNRPIVGKGMHPAEDARAWAAPGRVVYQDGARRGLSSKEGHETVLAVA